MRQTKPRQTKPHYATTTAQNAPHDDDPIPRNIDDSRDALARRINRFIADESGCWRDCPEPACRRRRGCACPNIECSNAPQLPPSTPEQTACAVAQFYRMLRESVERLRAQNDVAGK
jgi:hypothetical protein